MSVSEQVTYKAPQFRTGVPGYNPQEVGHDVGVRFSTRFRNSNLCKEPKKTYISDVIAKKKFIPAPN